MHVSIVLVKGTPWCCKFVQLKCCWTALAVLFGYCRCHLTLLDPKIWHGAASLHIGKPLQEIQEFEEFFLFSKSLRILSCSLKHLERFHLVSMNFQKEGLIPDKVRLSSLLFEKICSEYPSMKNYLAPCAEVVHNHRFVITFCKLLCRIKSHLSRLEKESLSRLLKEKGERIPKIGHWLLVSTFGGWTSTLGQQVNICEWSFLPSLSNPAERLFSSVQWVLTYWQINTSLILFKTILLLKLNRKLWFAVI